MSRSTTNNPKIIKYENKGYREIQAKSYSQLALYAENRIAYWKRYVLKEKDDELDSNNFVRMGKIVDVILTDNNNFDKYFKITSANKPSGQQLLFIEALFKLKIEDEKGLKDFITLSKEAYDIVKESNGGKLRDKYETFIDKFDKEGKDYYTELLESVNKTVITINEATIAQELVKKFNNCKAFAPKGDEIFRKFPIEFELAGEKYKMEADWIEIDNTEKIIYPSDIKVSSFLDDFIYTGFLKKRYYIQSSLYHFGISQWARGTKYKDYKVAPFSFRVIDALNQSEPLLYQCSDKDYENGFLGFWVGNKYYKGVFKLHEELKESEKLNRWGISIENFNNNGIVKIPIYKQTLDD